MDTKQQIYKKSAKLIAQYWYKNVSVDQIVQAIGIAKGTFYNYYDSKEDLYIDIIDAIFDHMKSNLSQLRKNVKSPKQRFYQYLHRIAFFYDENTIISNLSKANNLYYSKTINKKYLFKRFRKNLNCLFEKEEIDELEKKDIDLQDIAALVFSFILFLSNSDKLYLSKDYQDYLHKHIEILVNGVFVNDNTNFQTPNIEKLQKMKKECQGKVVFS